MLKVVIADDEYWVREELKEIIDWNYLGLSVVGEAENGEETLELLFREKPDILIADVKMPFYSGIDIINMINQSDLRCYVVIISGYDDFDYVKNAILLGAVDYLLKPIKETALTKVLIHIAEQISKDKNNQLERLEQVKRLQLAREIMMDNKFTQIIEAKNSYLGDVESLLENLTETNQCKYIEIIVLRVILLKSYDEESLLQIKELLKELFDNEKTAVFRHMVHDGEFCIVRCEDTSEAFLRNLASVLEKQWASFVRIGVSREKQGLNGFLYGYRRALRACNSIHIRSEEKIFLWNDESLRPNQKVSHQDESLMQSYIKANNSNEFIRQIKDLIGPEALEKLNYNEAYLIIGAVGDCIKRYVEENNEAAGESEKLIRRIRSCIERRELEKLEAIIEENSQTFLKAYHRESIVQKMPMLEQIKAYIQQNYYNDALSLALLSEVFAVNGDYISKKFKQIYGRNISTYIRDVRINKAVELITTSDMRISDIAISVGYSDYVYFTKIFKKSFGVTPRTYIKQHHYDKYEENHED